LLTRKRDSFALSLMQTEWQGIEQRSCDEGCSMYPFGRGDFGRSGQSDFIACDFVLDGSRNRQCAGNFAE
jgi:hypothetical protein